MQLLNELILTLSNANPKLIDCLTKTKVLLFEIGRKDLVDWVSNETNGYAQDAELPPYRLVHAQVKGNVANLGFLYPSHPLPTKHLNENQQKSLHQIEMRESIGVLENLLVDNKHGFSRPLPLEVCHLFDDVFTGGYTVHKAWCDIGCGQIDQIMIQVRSRLLDFLLELKDLLGSEETQDGVKEIAKLPAVASTFTNSIYGNNNTILFGNNNHQQIHIEQHIGDFTQLENTLRTNGVSQLDIEALKIALQSEPASSLKYEKRLGPKVGEWMKSMLSKAIDASWQIELGVAAGLLTTVIQKYYGWQ